MNLPLGLPSLGLRKKLLLLFLIDYLESPWNGGNCLKKQFLQCEHRLCAGAKLTCLLPGRILWREFSAPCLLFYVSWNQGLPQLGS